MNPLVVWHHHTGSWFYTGDTDRARVLVNEEVNVGNVDGTYLVEGDFNEGKGSTWDEAWRYYLGSELRPTTKGDDAMLRLQLMATDRPMLKKALEVMEHRSGVRLDDEYIRALVDVSDLDAEERDEVLNLFRTYNSLKDQEM